MANQLQQKLLSIVRHGTAPSGFGTTIDFERTLSTKGVTESLHCGSWLKKSLPDLPELILCSAATRTQQTLENIKQSWPELRHSKAIISESLYSASTTGVTRLISECGKSHSNILLIGHNPYVTELAIIYGKEALRLMPGNAVICHSHEDIQNWEESLILDHSWNMYTKPHT